jgi:hypothetical protein
MNRVARVALPALLAITFFGVSARAQRTPAGLIAAWEQEQKTDPKTSTFEKIKDGQYHFVTTQFPFDGTLQVRNVFIDDPRAADIYSASTGTVEIELYGVNEDFYRTYATSYARWNQSNTLYWLPKSQKWLSATDYFEQIRAKTSARDFAWPAMISIGWDGIFVVLVLALVAILWRNNRRMQLIGQRSERTMKLSEKNSQIAERNLQIQEENAKIFREILEQLKQRGS